MVCLNPSFGWVNPNFRVNITSGWLNPNSLGEIPYVDGEIPTFCLIQSPHFGSNSKHSAGCVLHALSQLPPQIRPQMGNWGFSSHLELTPTPWILDFTNQNHGDSGGTPKRAWCDCGCSPFPLTINYPIQGLVWFRSGPVHVPMPFSRLWRGLLQHIATYCNILQHIATNSSNKLRKKPSSSSIFAP